MKLSLKLFVLVIIGVLAMGALQKGKFIQLPGGGNSGNFSSEESDLMATVFHSAVKFLSGSASKAEVADELSEKLYSGRASAGVNSELGIEYVRPGEDGSAPANPNTPTQPDGQTLASNSGNLAKTASSTRNEPAAAKFDVSGKMLDPVVTSRILTFTKTFTWELSLLPAFLLTLVIVKKVRGRNRLDAFLLPEIPQSALDSEPFVMKHAVHSLKSEDFELLVAMLFQSQGYRVTMPAGLSGGRGGDFTLLRKSERLLVQCKKLGVENHVPVERLRELLDAAGAAGATKAVYVASCGFTWDARNFGKSKGMLLIDARALDDMLSVTAQKTMSDLLLVDQWRAKFFSKVKLTDPFCPT